MLIRQNGPVFGSSKSVYLEPGEWQFNASYRQSYADDHWRGSEEQKERHEFSTFVVNTQKMLDLTTTYGVNERISVGVGVPIVRSSWGIPNIKITPGQPIALTGGPRNNQVGQGLGDISATARYWVLDPYEHQSGNVSVGLGIKVPTGESHAKDIFPDLEGKNWEEKAVDNSVQPGDGGWGIIFEAQAFKRLGEKVSLFTSGNYLANPRDVNDTPSLTVGLNRSGIKAPDGRPLTYREIVESEKFKNNSYTAADTPSWLTLHNSVPDQYLVRAGVGYRLMDNLGVTAAYRIEGMQRRDLFGESHGARRPGRQMSFEPGLAYSAGNATWTVNLPIAFRNNRWPNAISASRGDATFPSYIVLVGYSRR